jgi:hypothetical protein
VGIPKSAAARASIERTSSRVKGRIVMFSPNKCAVAARPELRRVGWWA